MRTCQMTRVCYEMVFEKQLHLYLCMTSHTNYNVALIHKLIRDAIKFFNNTFRQTLSKWKFMYIFSNTLYASIQTSRNCLDTYNNNKKWWHPNIYLILISNNIMCMVYKILEVCHSHIHVYRFNFFRDRSIQTANNFA